MTRVPTLAILVLSLACSRSSALDIGTVPVGTAVAVTRDNGGVVRGTLAERSTDTVKIDTGLGVRTMARSEVADVQMVTATQPLVLPSRAQFLEYTLPAGTELVVSLNTAVTSRSSRMDDPVEAMVQTPIRQGDTTVVPAGSLLKGAVTSVETAGRAPGRASVALRFRTLTIIDHTSPYDVAVGLSRLTAPDVAMGESAEIDLPPGTILRMTLDQPVEVRIPIVRR